MKLRTRTKAGTIGPGDFFVSRAMNLNHSQTLKVRTGLKAGLLFPGWDPDMDAQQDAERN